MRQSKLQCVFKLLFLAILLFLMPFRAIAQGLRVEDRIPEFHLSDTAGKVQTFESVRGPKGAMLVFYQSADWCTFCKSQLIELEQSREELKKRGLGLAAVSYDSVATLKFFSDRRSIQVPLLSDEDSAVIRSFGILNEKVPKTSEFFGVPYPVTYIVDQKGVIRSRSADEDFRRRYTAGNLIDRRADAASVPAKRLKITRSASDSVVHGSQRVKIRLEIDLPSKSHVYAPGVQGYIPIDWKLSPSAAFEALPVRYPQSRNLHLKAIQETVPVYEGKFVLEREVIPAEKLTDPELRINGELRYQVCDDKQCFVPETAPVAWTMKYEPHDMTRAPAELRRKRR
jgi:peroxiredoxin